KLPLPLVYTLWDVYLVEDDPFLHYFVALALLIRNRSKLFQVDQFHLPQALSLLSLEDLGVLSSLIAKAKHYRARTPLSFRQQLYEISFRISNAETIRACSKRFSQLPCMFVPATEVVQQAYHQTLVTRAPRWAREWGADGAWHVFAGGWRHQVHGARLPARG